MTLNADTQFFHYLFLLTLMSHDSCIIFIPSSSWKFTSYDPLKTKIVGLLGMGGGGCTWYRTCETHLYPSLLGRCSSTKAGKTKALLILAVLYNNFGNDLPQHGSCKSLSVGKAPHWDYDAVGSNRVKDWEFPFLPYFKHDKSLGDTLDWQWQAWSSGEKNQTLKTPWGWSLNPKNWLTGTKQEVPLFELNYQF